MVDEKTRRPLSRMIPFSLDKINEICILDEF